MNQVVHKVLHFDRFVLDLTGGCLKAAGQDIPLRPKAYEVLHYLAENAGRLVTKEELYEAIWPAVIVSDDSIAQCIRELRHKLGDNDRRLIKTVSRRGYLLNTIVSAEAPQCQPAQPAVMMPPKAKPVPLGALQRLNIILLRHLNGLLAITAGVTLVAWLANYLLNSPVGSRGQISLAKSLVAVTQPRSSFKDCEDCPEMVALSAGEFTMGSPGGERGRQDVEGAPRRVFIPKRFAIGKFEITVDQFSRFVAETGITAGDLCHVIVAFDQGSLIWSQPNASFRRPGFELTGRQPVVCVNWHEAEGYAAWLGRRTGKPYRLPTESEWEYAARAGTRTTYSFGDDETALCLYARFADLGSRFSWHDACRSDAVAHGPLPVGSLKPNPWGIFDMHGNAWEWVEDCWTPNASEIPADGSAFSRPGSCEQGVVRGGSFAAASRRVRSAMRAPVPTTIHRYNIGFRVALSLDG
jgi:formylglycine-generating enzyme required for sulfatase activity